MRLSGLKVATTKTLFMIMSLVASEVFFYRNGIIGLLYKSYGLSKLALKRGLILKNHIDHAFFQKMDNLGPK